MADSDALRARRAYAHRNGDHELCRHRSLGQTAVAPDGDGGLMTAVASEFPESDPMSLAIASRLAELAIAGRGAAAVAAVRALAELVAHQRASAPTSGGRLEELRRARRSR